MNLFGLENSSFLLSLGISILVSAAVMYYCLGKFSVLENSIIEQGKVIQSFIMRMNTMTISGNSMANEQATENAVQLSKKIDVSDDEDDDDDDDDDHDDDDDDDDNDVDDDVNNTNKNLILSGGNLMEPDSEDSFSDISSENNDSILDNDLNIVTDITDITDISDIIGNNDLIKHIEIEEITELPFSTYQTIEKNTTHPSNINSEISSILSDDIDNNNNQPIEKVNNTIEKTEKESDTISFNKMKVAELRKLVIEKNLTNSSDGSKLKKDELINLLQK